MNYELIKNKVWKTLNLKKSPGKTQMGIEVGWMVDCKIKHRALLWLSLVITRHFFSPIGLGCLLVYSHERFFEPDEPKYEKNKEIMKENNPWNGFAHKPREASRIIKRNHDQN